MPTYIVAANPKGMEVARELVAWSAWIALGCYALAWFRGLRCHPVTPGVTSSVQPDRGWWTATGLMFWIHFLLAFQVEHSWSHRAALLHTARRTGEMVGWELGYGLYVNYLFLIAWVADITWYWVSPTGYPVRRSWIARSIHAFFLFVIINGAVVFVQGPMRWISMLVLSVLGILWRSRVLAKTESGPAP